MTCAHSVHATRGTNSDAEGTLAAPGIARWLCLAASPTFALMAWIAAHHASPMMLCSSGPGMLPMGGMSAMYLLMSLFHLPPWLKLASSRTWAGTRPIAKGG
jgi:hypothetical protein